MKVKIGKHKVINTQTLIVFDNSDAWMEFTFDNWEIKVNIIPETDKENPNGSWSLEGKEDHAVIRLVNWKEGSGLAMKEMFLFGTTDNGKKVYIMIFGNRAGTALKLDVQFYEGAEND